MTRIWNLIRSFVSFVQRSNSPRWCIFPDVLSSLSSMSSLTPEQSANATPDASLQPSSMNSAQRYLYACFFIYFSSSSQSISLYRDTEQRRTQEEPRAHRRVRGAHEHSTEGTGRLQQADTDHPDDAHVPRRWVNIFLIVAFNCCTYLRVTSHSWSLTKETSILDIRSHVFSCYWIHSFFF